MSTLNIVMMICFAAGLLTFMVSFISLIADRKRKRSARRDSRRSHISENTVKAVLNYSRGSYSLRKSS